MAAGGGRPGNGTPDEPRVLRPEYALLGEEALVPATNVVRPPPGPTHELGTDEPYWLDRPGRRGPDGVLPAGTAVALLSWREDRCRVVTGSGLAVDVRPTSLRELPAQP